ncbi:MAG TPA: M48 family metallopeptidase, partial [Thermoanaerobaculia bacterium]|nr:M48 family metallopeptidase [Thermoanaerobaculia bacterium]
MRHAALVLALILVAIPLSAQQGEAFDVDAATRAYLDRPSPEEKARSDAYFEGRYWIQLWSFLLGIALAWALLHFRISRWIRDRATRVTRFATVHRFAYWLGYLILTSLVLLPWTIYTGYFREHRYGLSNQTIGGFMGDFAKGLVVSAIFGGILVALIYSVISKHPTSWWIRGALVLVTFLIIGIAIGPVFIAPLFNEYTPLEDPEVREPIVRMAHANGIESDQVWVMDASRQTSRISANVSGLLGTERITLNDNLLERTSLAEIEAVMGHEIGHYALHHIWKMIVMLGVVIVVGFAFLRWGFERLSARWGAQWGVEGPGDLAGLPLLAALFATFFFIATPVTNTIIRVQEAEADLFGLNAARQPDGFAEVALKL